MIDCAREYFAHAGTIVNQERMRVFFRIEAQLK